MSFYLTERETGHVIYNLHTYGEFLNKRQQIWHPLKLNGTPDQGPQIQAFLDVSLAIQNRTLVLNAIVGSKF